MARTPQITRTVITTKAKVMCLNILKGDSEVKEVILPRTYKNDAQVLKVAHKVIDNDEIKAVHILTTEIEETLYGMSEQKFIENAEKLPPRKDYTKTNN